MIAGLIGRGGMGEVVRGHDIEIGRDVAIKRLRGAQASADAVARFLREAKIQARLEHPAIIPVHTIGRDAEGQPYVTMKRITGVTLVELLAKGDQPRQRLLRGGDISPASRRPDREIPPELDALCTAALHRDSTKRPSAREVGDRIEGFLDGDRDIAAHRRIVALELSEARDAVASGEPARRAEAMQAAARAQLLPRQP